MEGCSRTFWQRFARILPRMRAIERWFLDSLRKQAGERACPCPQVLGIDEHFFIRKKGFAPTFCDLKHHKVYDVVPGRSEASLEGYLNRLEGKHLVKVVCRDLAAVTVPWCANTFPAPVLWQIVFTSSGW